jgi:hypothetical protein
MANAKLTALTEDNGPLGSDLGYVVDGAANSRKRYLPDFSLLPEGYMLNGKLSVTVASSDITVALKTLSGGNPSATDPVSVWINGAFRRCTAALSVTKNDATNWFNSGAAEFAAQEVDYFAYLIWNTTPATDILDLGFARFPSGRVYSDFSGTTTNEKYLATANASAPTSTDACVNIGRFAATLSAGAGYTWSVPTYTNANLIQHPVFRTRTLLYTPTWGSTGTLPAIGDGTLVGQYKLRGAECKVRVRQVCGASSTYGTGTYTWSLPFTSTTFTNGAYPGVGRVFDANTTTTYAGFANIASAAATVNLTTHAATGAVSGTVPVTMTTSDQVVIATEFAIA